MHKRSFALRALATALVVLALGSTGHARAASPGQSPSQAADQSPIPIGVYQPMTGSLAAGGQMTMEGISLAHALRPNVLGRPVRLILVDNKSDKVEAANAVARLVEKDRVVAIIGSYGSSLSIAGGAVAEKARVPVVGDSPTNPLVTQGKKYYIRVCFIDPFQGEVMANYAYNVLGARTAAIIQDVAQDYSVGLATFFRKVFVEFTGNPGSIVSVASYQTGDQDFTAQLVSVARNRPDVIFAPGYYAEAALLARQARELGIKTPLLGGDAWEAPELIEIAGPYAEGLTFSTHYSAQDVSRPVARNFVEAYRKRYGKEPNAFAALGFDAYNALLDSIERAGRPDRELVNEALHSLKGWEGVTGTITIDENGNARKSAVILQVRNGKFDFVTSINP